MRTNETWMVAALCGALAACAGEIDDPVASDEDIALASASLAARGNTLWIAPRGERTVTIYYCFENASALAFGPSSVRYALDITWQRYANVAFVDEGACASAAHASSAVHVHGWDQQGGLVEKFGKEIAGIKNGLHLPTTDALVQKSCPWTPTNVCFQAIAAHEFGHALGFWHEWLREDWDPVVCNGSGASSGGAHPLPPEQLPDTLITAWDVYSLMEQSYCRDMSVPTLTTMDIAGVAAIYGASNKAQGTMYVRYFGQKAIRFQSNSRWLQPTQTGGANVQTFVGDWERIRINRIGGAPQDGSVHYGDEVAIADRFGKFLSGLDTNDVVMLSPRGDWERWKVETIDNAKYPNGSRVEVNAPLRLRNIRWNRWLGVTSGGDVLLTNATSTSELRINGDFVTR